jgi:hypothetical protein
MATVTWVNPRNSDLVRNIFEEVNIITLTMQDGKKVPVVSWQRAVNPYDTPYKDHFRLMNKAEITFERTNAGGRTLKERITERGEQIADLLEINRLLQPMNINHTERIAELERLIACSGLE